MYILDLESLKPYLIGLFVLNVVLFLLIWYKLQDLNEKLDGVEEKVNDIYKMLR